MCWIGRWQTRILIAAAALHPCVNSAGLIVRQRVRPARAATALGRSSAVHISTNQKIASTPVLRILFRAFVN
jgi:hypothetical protein